MGVSIAETGWARTRKASGAEVAQLTLHLGLHVDRLLALPHPPLVAGDHELTDLLPQAFVRRRGRALGELRDLGVHVERRLAARHPPVRLRLHELADLLVGLRLRGRAARRGAAAA